MIVKKIGHVLTLKGVISAPIIFNNGYERPQPTATEVRAKRAVECFIDINQNLYRSWSFRSGIEKFCFLIN